MKNKLLFIILFYTITSIFLNINNHILYHNIIYPLSSFIILIYLYFYKKNTYLRLYQNKKTTLYTFIILLIYLIIYIILFLIFGISKNPYNHSFLSILKNIFIMIIPLLATELTKIILIKENKNNFKIIFIIIILLTLIEIDFYTLINTISKTKELFKYVCENILPIISYNILSTYLILKNFYQLVIFSKLFTKLTIIILPVLPNTDWFINSTTTLLISIIIYVLIRYKFTKTQKIKKIDKISYAFTITISIFIICFMTGLFIYEPIAILSNSMHPIFTKGDIIIYKKNKNIKRNDIIIYTTNEKTIAHRVVEIIKNNNKTLYRTKGDANKEFDQKLVKPKQIKGIYKFHIKFLGFPSVWLNNYFNNKVEMK